MRRSIALLFVTAMIIEITTQVYAEPVVLEKRVFERAILNRGDLSRLKKAMQKAQNGGKFVVGTIGGSITQGALASTPDKNWSSLVAKWWQQKFPRAKVRLVNAGIGATGSLIGAHRAYRDLLKYKPDFVVCEFSVNDPNDELAAETLEGLVRQALNGANHPPVMLLFTMYLDGGNSQEWHSKVGYYYRLPMISARDALVPEINAGRMKWTDVLADQVHPNDVGHAYYAGFITYLLDQTLADLDATTKIAETSRLPKPLISSVFEHTAIYNPDNMKPIANDGWEQGETWGFGKTWKTDKVGAQIEFEVAGDTVSLLYFKIKSDMGMAEARVDDREPVKLDGWFDQDWGGYSSYQILGRNIGPGKHKVRVKVLDEKNPASKGHRFEIDGILSAGR